MLLIILTKSSIFLRLVINCDVVFLILLNAIPTSLVLFFNYFKILKELSPIFFVVSEEMKALSML